MSTSTKPSLLKRLLRFLIRGLAILLTLIAVGWVVENWRAERYWSTVKAQLEKSHAQLDRSAYIPPLVPDASNFAALPFWTDHFKAPAYGGHERGTVRLPEIPKALRHETTHKNALQTPLEHYAAAFAASTNWPGFTRTDNPAADVVRACQSYDPALKVLREGIDRPESRFPIRYEDGYRALLPHLATFITLHSLLDVRIRAFLETTNAAPAFEDLRFAFQLSGTLSNETFLISQAVARRQLRMTIHGLWSGLERHAWSADQLRWCQERLGQTDVLGLALRSVEAERATVQTFFEAGLSDSAFLWRMHLTLHNSDPEFSWMFLPRFVVRQNQARYHVALQQLIRVLETGALRHPENAPRSGFTYIGLEADTEPWPYDLKAAKLQREGPYTVFARSMLPAPSEFLRDLTSTLTLARMAEIACALERFHQANHEFPRTLDALSPEWLRVVPQDPLARTSFQYVRHADDTYELRAARPDWIWGRDFVEDAVP